MFIYSIRASTLRLFGIILLGLVLTFGVILSIGGERTVAVGSNAEIDYSGIKTREDRIAFMERFGIEVDADSEGEGAFRLPENLDRVILGYNELQKKQGLDITKYKNKRVTRYSYKVTNYNCDGEVYANLFIYRGKVVACDLSSADPRGFVIPLTQVERSNLK